MALRLHWLTLCLAAAATAAPAQNLPDALPRLPVDVPGTLARPLDRAAAPLHELRVRNLLRAHPRELDSDRAGQPVVRGELLAIAPSPAALEAAAARGFPVLRSTTMAELGLRVVVLQAPPGQRTRRALRTLRRLDPAGHYDFNHLYLPSQAAWSSPYAAIAGSGAAAAAPAVRVGLVDSGVDARHPALRSVDVQTWGCGGTPRPDRHGTAVASLLAGQRGGQAAARSQLFAADIYCGRPVGGAVTELAQAFDWLVRERVAVVNVSLVGPPNDLLAQLVSALQARGHVLVAAAGNEGPAAPARYPAAYPGVIGVTALGPRGVPLPEAATGAHVDFAAPGAGFFAAAPGGGWWPVRGTSFAAPLVARLAAAQGPLPDRLLATRVEQRLAQAARDAGVPGRDNRFGHGALAEEAAAAWPERINEP